MKHSLARVACAVFALAFLGACASSGYHGSYPSQQYPAANSGHARSAPHPYSYPPTTQARNYGVVESIQLVHSGGNQASGGGAVIGGVIGGLLGHQVGAGRGKTAATIGGAVGGALLGNRIEQQNNGQGRTLYHVGVRMHDGSYRTIEQEQVQELQVGSRVRVENNIVYRY